MGRPKGSKNKSKDTWGEGPSIPHATEVPPPPPQDPRYGDKTPAFAEYMFKFFPDRAKQMYAGRKIMGKVMPSVIHDLPPYERKELPPLEADLPSDAMETEPSEIWVKK